MRSVTRAMRAMRGNTLEAVPFQPYFGLHRKLPQSTGKPVLPSNESYESETGCNCILATVLWVGLRMAWLALQYLGAPRCPDPDLPILAFFRFLRFLHLGVFLAFCAFLLSFSKDFKGSAEGKILAFFRGSSLFCQKRKDLEGQGMLGENSTEMCYYHTPLGAPLVAPYG